MARSGATSARAGGWVDGTLELESVGAEQGVARSAASVSAS